MSHILWIISVIISNKSVLTECVANNNQLWGGVMRPRMMEMKEFMLPPQSRLSSNNSMFHIHNLYLLKNNTSCLSLLVTNAVEPTGNRFVSVITCIITAINGSSLRSVS